MPPSTRRRCVRSLVAQPTRRRRHVLGAEVRPAWSMTSRGQCLPVARACMQEQAIAHPAEQGGDGGRGGGVEDDPRFWSARTAWTINCRYWPSIAPIRPRSRASLSASRIASSISRDSTGSIASRSLSSASISVFVVLLTVASLVKRTQGQRRFRLSSARGGTEHPLCGHHRHHERHTFPALRAFGESDRGTRGYLLTLDPLRRMWPSRRLDHRGFWSHRGVQAFVRLGPAIRGGPDPQESSRLADGMLTRAREANQVHRPVLPSPASRVSTAAGRVSVSSISRERSISDPSAIVGSCTHKARRDQAHREPGA